MTEPAAAPSDQIEQIRTGYAFKGAALEIGALVVDGEPRADVPVRIPFRMLNRHGLVAGATGTGKTKTLQVLAEQIAAGGVPVFAADIKGDLSGIATAGTASEPLLERTRSIGQDWQPTASATEFLTLGGRGTGTPIRATVDAFGPVLLAKVLDLNATQESSLALVFHYARKAELRLVTLEDLRAVVAFLDSDEGKPELKAIGGLSSATVGVILRELVTFADTGADAFFGEPSFDVADILRTAADGRGIVSLLEVPGVQDQPRLFSTFLMFLLRELFSTLPEVGDTDKPKLVFFFDEAHLLFKDASKDFLEIVVQTVRLIRSKGVGVFFVTQTPKDVPDDVLAQLGSRVQHQLRAHTPQDAKALRATVSTYPHSDYDLEEVLTQLATGEAIVTVMNEKGAPSPVAWTRVRAPQGSMDPSAPDVLEAAVAASPLTTKYAARAAGGGAASVLAERSATAAAAEAEVVAAEAERKRAAEESARLEKDLGRSTTRSRGRTTRRMSPMEKAIGEASRTAAREIVKAIFTRKKR
ncbi:helicase HerA-like domain-containing protein [Aeromicrobium sp.]|uniref:helicase HerA-like domain-containing protein n=1 Tax=Aeromicrobium sp. TaxID=1871063 RepID=UPI0028A946B6|nr:helicase HerA-like domain-containing protein [Aeromicrobium sp.]